MENKRGQGIFLGIVGVATLVVAIIGATFAYFSASVSGDNEVNLEAYKFDAHLKIDNLAEGATNKLIPLLPDGPTDREGYAAGNNAYLLAAVNNTNGKGICTDNNGYQVCELVRATFTNNSTTAISLNGEMTASVNGFTNLEVIELAYNEETSKYSVVGTAKPAPAEGATPGIELSPVNGLANGTPVVKYFAVYLKDNGDQKAEMGQKFTGTITYTSAVGGSQLTGQFTVTQ